MPTLPTHPKSILIVKLSSIGDVIHALPVASALRRRFPDSRISWLVSQKAHEIVSGHPHLDTVIVIGESASEGEVAIPDIRHPLQAARVLRSFRFDVAIDLQGLLRSGLFAYLSGARCRIGQRGIKEAAFLFYTVRPLSPARDRHVVDSYLRFAALLGADTTPAEFIIATTTEHEAKVDALLATHGIEQRQRLLILSPASSWRAKIWPPERLGEVADHLARRHGLLPIVVGAQSDAARAQAVVAFCRSPIVNLSGKTSLKELTVLLRRSTAWIGNDSGPTHLAAALGLPVIAVYGPTDHLLLGPYGEGNVALVSTVPCRPCRRRSRAESCRHLECLMNVSVAQVCAAADTVIERTEPTPSERRQ